MAKKLVATGFRIDTAENAIYLEGNILHQRLLLITDVTVNRILYNFADEGSGLISINYDQIADETVLILRQSMSSLGVNNNDTLQVLIEEEATSFRPEDPFLDPVSKIRVSTPENLIDTDFEYGLQATKWETLKLVNNIPSFYSKNGVSDIVVTSAQCTTGDNNVIVTATNHGLAIGSPFEITGLSNSQFEGGYIVTSVISLDQFSYQLPFFSQTTQELSTVYTTVLPGAFYFGSQITVVDIKTNGLPESHLTVETRFPHGFSMETPFYFLNTVAVFRQDISVEEFVIDDTITNEKSTATTDVGESTVDWRNSSINPYNFIGKNVRYFDETNVITDVYVPVSSTRMISQGSGYKIKPVAFPRDVATANANSYQISINGSTGINATTEVITTAANNFQTGDRVEILHTQVIDRGVNTNYIAEEVLYRPFGIYWMGAENITQLGNTTQGYAPTAIGSAATFGGIQQSGTAATITVSAINVTGTLEIGQEIQMRNSAGVVQFPVGVKISAINLSVGEYTIGLTYSAPAPTGVNQFTGSLYATTIDSIQNTFKVVDHGFENGDFVNYFFINQTGGTGSFPASNAGPAGLTDNTGYYVIKRDDNHFKLATTRENAFQDIPIDITDIGYGTQSAGALYGAQVSFVGVSKSVYWRRLSSTTGALFPTRADALANTNRINIRQIGNVANNLTITAGRAVYDVNLTGDQVTSVDVLDGGWTYNQNSTIPIVPFSITKFIQTGNDGGGLSTGSNTLRVKQEAYDTPLVTGMRVSGTGIQANTTVQSVQGPDVNGFLDVVISPVTNGNLAIGASIRFIDNNSSTATVVPNVRARCINYTAHGFNLADPVFFVCPPNPQGITATQFPTGILESRVYWAVPIDDDHFALTAARQTSFSTTTAGGAASPTASNARQNISTRGTTHNGRKFMFTRATEITAAGTVNLITNSLQLRNNVITPPVDPEDLASRIYLNVGDPVIVALDNAANGSIAGSPNLTTVSAQNASAQTNLHRIYYVRNIIGQNQIQLSTTPGGAVSTITSRTNVSFIVPVIAIQEFDSVYIPNHGFQENDFITYTTTGVAIAGLNAAAGSNGYNISRLSDDRFKLKRVDNGALLDFTNFGSGTHTFSNTKFNPLANVIQKIEHGFETGNVVTYDADGKPVVDGLISNNQYYVKKVSDDGFRVAPTGEDLKITGVSKALNATVMTITFEKNHGLSVGDSIIIRDNPAANGYMNNFWTVATVPATPVVAGSPSTITVNIPSYIDKYPVVTQNITAGRTYGIAFKYVNFKYVTANNAIITPAAIGDTFTTLRAFDSQIAKETPLVSGGSIVANQRVRTSTVIPTGSLVDSVSGSTIRTAKIYFNRKPIDEIERSSNVVTVTTVDDHNYTTGQTIIISGITTTSFNTGYTPVAITVTGDKTFTFSQSGADEVDEDGGFADIALTSAQASSFAANGIDANTGTSNLTIQATTTASGYPNNLIIRAAAASLPRVTKTLPAGAGLIGQTALTLPNLDEILVGMPVSGTGIQTNPVALVKRIISNTAPFQIELTQPLTANTVTTSNAYTFYKTQIGQEWRATTPHASETVRANTNAGNEFRLTVGPVPAAANNSTAVGHFVTGVRASSTFAADEDPDTNTFEVPTTDNVITVPRAILTRYVGPNPYTGPQSYLGATAPGTAGTTTTAGAGWTNIRQFETGVGPGSVVNVNADALTIVSHPYITGDRVVYDTRGGGAIAPLVDGNTYYIIASDTVPSLGADGIQLALTEEDALAGTQIDLTTFGDGTFHRLWSPYVLQGSSGALTGSIASAVGTINVGMTIQHVSTAATPLFETTIPVGTKVAEIIDHGVSRSYGNAFKYRIVVDNLMTGVVGSSTSSALAVTNGRIRAGAFSSGTRIFTNDTTGLAVGMKVEIGTNAAGTLGTLSQNTLVTAIDPSGKYFDVNIAPSSTLNCVRIVAGTGTSETANTTIFTSDTTGLIVGMVLAVDSSSSAGGAGAITAISDTDHLTTTRVLSIAQDGKSFTTSRAFATALKAAKISGGASGAGTAATGNQTRIYVYDVTNIRRGMFIKVTGGDGDINSTPNAAAGKVVNTIVNNSVTERYITLCTANTVWAATVTATEPNATVTTASLAIGVNSATDKIHLPSVSGFNTGMEIVLDAAFAGSLGAGTTTISSIDPVLRTITVSPQPSTVLQSAQITGTIENGIIEGLYVSSNEPNFPIGATVTDVTGTTITISAPHGGVRSGQAVTFSPFAEGTTVTTISADATNGCRVVLSQAHAGLLGGTNVEFRKLPPNCFLSGWRAFSTTTWDHVITPRIGLPANLLVDNTTSTSAQFNKRYEFIGSDKNLGSITDFETNGTHIFTRSSNADGVYTIEDIPSPTEFVVRTQGFIPFNTKSFLDSNVDYVSDFIFIANHKFRDGTSLIYRKGAPIEIPTLPYIDANGDEQTSLKDGATYFAVVVDPNFIKLAATFDDAVAQEPVTIELDENATPMEGQQSFDTFSILGLTSGDGVVKVTVESDIVTGIGTKFLTNFKGGDILRFYTAANPGLIFNYTVASVKSDTSLKLQSPVESSVVAFDAIVDRTTSGSTAIATGGAIQTMTINSATGLAVGYIVSDVLQQYFAPDTRITAINGNILSLNKPVLVTVPTAASIIIQPVFQYFINTNVYVKSNAITVHRPFDGGVTMTTGLVPDSTITRQSRRYFRYQSGKGIQCSMAINFNPPTDCEELTSTENVAKIKVDVPHGFRPGTTNRIRVTEAEVLSGHNGYNGEFDILEVINDYEFTYVYEDTKLIGKFTNGTSTVSNVASFNGIEVGKIVKAGIYEGITVPADTFITAIDQTLKTVTLDKLVSGNTATLDISTIERNNNVVTVVTTTDHGLLNDDWIGVQNVTDTLLNISSAQVEVLDNTTFTYTQTGVDGSDTTGSVIVLTVSTAYRQNGSAVAYGFPKFNLKSWQDALIRAGLFDTQNGMFFEYDGNNLYCVRRSSVQQLSGKATATYRSSLITGTNTKFTTQLSEGDFVVIRGMSYKVIGISSDTQMYIQPEYRGSTLTNIVVTKTEDARVPQSQWNLDKADGRGRSGFILDINKIQMVYIDYSWYGAGKIRFGFKNAKGEVVYFHEFVHNNIFTEAYMRSGNVPARYEVVTFGQPTFSPQLFHWGTSVIMDGRFDDDKAYLFTADSNVISLTNGASVQANSSTGAQGGSFFFNQNFITIQQTEASKFTKGALIIFAGSGSPTSANQPDTTNQFLPAGTKVDSVDLSVSATQARVFLTNRFRRSSQISSTNVNKFIVGGSGGTNVSIASLSPIPLVSIRLSPSVDNGLSGGLGFRDIINRMQLTLNSCGVLVSHESEVRLFLNGELSDSDFANNQSPSLSQLYRHEPGQTIKNGVQLFSFRASGGTKDSSTGKRTLVQTSAELGEIATLGNSILGGDEVFPNGPDILTITATPIDTSTINATEPYQASARITWSESQA